MAIDRIDVLKTTRNDFGGLQAKVKVEPPFGWDQLRTCTGCQKYIRGCSGPVGEYNNILTLNFPRYVDEALRAFDEAKCGLGVFWRSYVEQETS